MSTRTIFVALLALTCGACAVILVYNFLGRVGRAAPAGDMIQVVTAATDVARGQVLDKNMLKAVSYQKQDVPKGALTELDNAIGRTVIIPILTGDLIVAGKLAEKGTLPVVTAASDAKRGQDLDAKMLKVSYYPQQDVPKGALAELDDAVGRTVIVPLVAGEPILAGKLTEKGTLPVVTAAIDAQRGQVLDAKMLKVRYYQKQDVPNGALAAVEDAVGRTVIVPLFTGEPILAGKLAEKGAGRDLAAMIPDGLRAFTIEMPHLAADVGGFIMPSNHVDVLLTTSPAGGDDQSGGGVTTTLLQNVQVLAVAQKLEAPEDNKPITNDIKIVTLLVTPDQAAKLDLGMNKGILHLALRNSRDDREATTRPATMNDLRFHREKPIDLPTPQVQQATYTITTLRGLTQDSKSFVVPR